MACTTLKKTNFLAKEVHRSERLTILQLSENTFQHISYKQTNDFGNVPCNGLIVRNNGEALVLDTPTNDLDAEALIKWLQTTLRCEVKAVVPTHFHDDCLGGLQAFHHYGVPSYAYTKTIELARQNKYVVPQRAFADSLVLTVGQERVIVRFLGEGHTPDNVVGYFPSEQVLFGGCLVKELQASKGYLGDANVSEWSATIEQVKRAYPLVKVVVPGHGQSGNARLLDYTKNLFKVRNFGESKLNKIGN